MALALEEVLDAALVEVIDARRALECTLELLVRCHVAGVVAEVLNPIIDNLFLDGRQVERVRLIPSVVDEPLQLTKLTIVALKGEIEAPGLPLPVVVLDERDVQGHLSSPSPRSVPRRAL